MSTPLGSTSVVHPVRLLVPADVPRVVALERVLFGPSAWSEGMIREELEASARWYVAIDGEALLPGEVHQDVMSRCVAYAGLWFDGDVAQVMTIGVAPGAQRRGLGATLLTALADRARELGADSVLLEVRVDNAAAIALYERFAFTVVGRRRRYYQPEDVDAWTMQLPLR